MFEIHHVNENLLISKVRIRPISTCEYITEAESQEISRKYGLACDMVETEQGFGIALTHSDVEGKSAPFDIARELLLHPLFSDVQMLVETSDKDVLTGKIVFVLPLPVDKKIILGVAYQIAQTLETSEYWGCVRWHDDDVKNALISEGFSPSAEAVGIIHDACQHHNLQDQMIAAGWDVIHSIICEKESELEALTQNATKK